jgi:hypothetical protein
VAVLDEPAKKNDKPSLSELGPVASSAATGAGVPSISKPSLLGEATAKTSPMSLWARDLPKIGRMSLPSFMSKIPAPTYKNLNSSVATIGGLIGRAAPVVGAVATVAQIAVADNKMRSTAGAIGGITGAAIGATLTVETVVGMPAGAILGSFAGTAIGYKSYDYMFGEPK